eukprot:126470-Rhodomonas_salina.1
MLRLCSPSSQRMPRVSHVGYAPAAAVCISIYAPSADGCVLGSVHAYTGAVYVSRLATEPEPSS